MSVIESYHYHHDDEPLFFGEYNGKSPYLGVELEVDRKDCMEHFAEEKCCREVISKFPEGFLYMEEDGSLEYGFENITSPATFEYHVSLAENYREAFNTLVKNKYISHNTKTCGLHVHFNRDFYEENEELYLTRLLYLVEKFWDNMVIFSRRNIRRIQSWAKKYECSPEEVINDMKHKNLDRYYAVNLTNDNTIELRMFRGTLNIETFMATLEFCNTIILVAKEKTVEDIQRMNWEDLLKTEVTKKYWESCLKREEAREEKRRQREEERKNRELMGQ